MSLSKSAKHYRCLSRSVRSYQAESSTESTKMQTPRSMSMTQWKLILSFKDYIAKSYEGKSFHTVLNKELARLMQRLHPSIYGKELVRSIESSSNAIAAVNDKRMTKPKTEPKEQTSYNLPQVLNELKMKIGVKSDDKSVDVVKPKVKPIEVSKTSICSRTDHLLNSIVTAESDRSKLKRIEDLSQHLLQFPDYKSHAIKNGAVSVLLRLREKTKNLELKMAIREAFCILGYFDPPPGRGIRILSIDGGGIRGIVVIKMLAKLQELTGKKVHEMFDYICGVSTGAIIALGTGGKMTDLEELYNNYKEMSVKVFKQNPIWGAGSLVWNHSFYDTSKWEQLLKDMYQDDILFKTSRILNAPKLGAVSTVVNRQRVSAYVFRNYCLPHKVHSQYIGGNQYKLWEAVRASAAAPTYFEEFKLDDNLHQDGGIIVNNPTSVAIHEAKQIWPDSDIQCVISFGTGRTSHPHVPENVKTNVSSWSTKFQRILESATDTEAVHITLNDLLPDNVYYRFNPYLTEMLDMSEIDQKKIALLESDVQMYIRRNEDKFQHAAKVLLEPRTFRQKCWDIWKIQRDMRINAKL